MKKNYGSILKKFNQKTMGSSAAAWDMEQFELDQLYFANRQRDFYFNTQSLSKIDEIWKLSEILIERFETITQNKTYNRKTVNSFVRGELHLAKKVQLISALSDTVWDYFSQNRFRIARVNKDYPKLVDELVTNQYITENELTALQWWICSRFDYLMDLRYVRMHEYAYTTTE